MDAPLLARLMAKRAVRRFFPNKVIWITGASSGIGQALAEAAVAAGARVIISARREGLLEALQATLGPTQCAVLPLDLTDSASFPAKVAAALACFGHIDVMVHNGGISQRAWAAETLLEVDRQIMEVDYFGYVGLTKALLPHFQERQQGHFVVVTSVLGKIGTPKRTAYAAAKHALHGFFDSLRAEEWRHGIEVTLVTPGYIRTAISDFALTGQGAPMGQTDQDIATGYPAAATAQQMLRAIARRRAEVYVGRKISKERLSLLVKRFWPSLLRRLVRKAVPK